MVLFRREAQRCECSCCCDDLRRDGYEIDYLPHVAAVHRKVSGERHAYRLSFSRPAGGGGECGWLVDGQEEVSVTAKAPPVREIARQRDEVWYRLYPFPVPETL